MSSNDSDGQGIIICVSGNASSAHSSLSHIAVCVMHGVRITVEIISVMDTLHMQLIMFEGSSCVGHMLCRRTALILLIFCMFLLKWKQKLMHLLHTTYNLLTFLLSIERS